MSLAWKPATLTAAALLFTATASAQAPWLNMVNETSSRLVAKTSLVLNDNIEKDFAIGDFDKDGWVDVVMMRKFPGSIQGGFPNVLFMNEQGVLVDRTVEYAAQSDQAGYQGFLDPTNDRDVKAVDVDGDGWLDLVTATTMSDGLVDIIGQPRVYMNLGNDGNGNWLGFKHIRDRLPHIFPPNNNPTANPRFCEVAVGDFNGDGFPDLFYVDYDTPETSGTQLLDLNNDGDTNDPGESQQSPGESSNDFNNKLIFNWGNGGPGPGYFYDTTTTVMTTAQLASAFGNSTVAGDFTGDGKDDIARITTLTSGQTTSIFTRGASGSTFLGPKNFGSSAPYFVEKGDLNGDGKLDVVIADDSKDVYCINTGNDALGQPNFTQFTIADSASEFGNTIRIHDWDKDGKPDVIIVDVDADLPTFCPTTGRRTHIYRNVYSGSNSGILEEATASFTKPFTDAQLQAWFDVAPIDLDKDGWTDMIVGRCAGVEVWMNRQVSITFAYPSGRPSILTPGQATNFPVTMTSNGNGSLLAGSAKLHYSVNGGAWSEVALNPNDSANYTATLPAVACGDQVEYYIEGSMTTGGPYYSPNNAPNSSFSVSAGTATVTALSTSFESGLDGFTVVSSNMSAGMKGWETATPIATTLNSKPWAPGTAANGTKALVTMNGAAGGTAVASDLDGGPTIATSPVFDLSTVAHPILSYSRWYACDDTLTASDVDPLFVEVSNDGGTNWVLVEKVDYHGVNSWVSKSFNLEDFVAPTNAMQIRFRISDFPDNSTTEAAIDNVVVSGAQCPAATPCPADVNNDGVVDGADLGLVIGGWGQPGASDVNEDGTTDGADLGLVIGAWGNCP